MSEKHTPGPWRAYESSDDGWFNIEAESDGSDVVGCEGCANEANAYLIAASPCLLEAVADYLNPLACRQKTHEKMMAAFAKATKEGER